MKAEHLGAVNQPATPAPGLSTSTAEPGRLSALVMQSSQRLLWVGLAFLVNAYLSVPVFSTQLIHLGQSVTLLVLLLHGWRLALLVSAGAAAGLWWSGEGFIGPTLVLAETLTVAVLLQRRVPIVPGMLLFWLLLGAPVRYLVALLGGMAPGQPVQVEMLLQAASGVLSASITAVVFQLVIHRISRERRLRMQHIELSRQAFAMAVTLVMLPALSVSLLLVDRSVAILGTDLQSRLQRDAFEYSAVARLYLSQHRKALELLAQRHPGELDQALFEDLEQLQRGMSGFLTMIAVDAQGLVVHGAPRQRFESVLALPHEQRNVADRGYFRNARDRGEAVMSDGMVGRGFGSDPIVAVSVPLKDSEGTFRGVVEGSLNLPGLGRVGASRADNSLVVVADSAGQVVAASPDADSGRPFLTLLSKPAFALDPPHPLVDIPQVTLDGTPYFIAEADTSDGWTVYGLAPTAILTGPIERFTFAFSLGVVALLALGAGISGTFSASITRPLQTLIQQIRDPGAQRVVLPEAQRNSPEIAQVEAALDQARQLNIGFRQQVEREIAEKTRQLREANQALEALTVEDPLTGVSNRRGLEDGLRAKLDIAARQKLNITVAMIDIDHFKRINDEFGHAVGDECLRQVADKLRSTFRRRGDLIARYGGEEFTVVTVSEEGGSELLRLEQFRRAMETQRFNALPVDRRLSVSIGVRTGVPDPDTTAESMIKIADEALYVSKRSGRNCLTTA